MFGMEILVLSHTIENAHVLKANENFSTLNKKVIEQKIENWTSTLQKIVQNKIIEASSNKYKISIFFDFNSEVPKSSNALEQLHNVNFKKVTSIVIDGYASAPGTNQYNLILSDKRIERLVKIIRQLGYDKEIKTVPHGEDCLGWEKEEQCQRIDMQLFF
ncbi:OmpA domain-containing protein (plasmid) [Aliarcobacter cibarius]|uniref:OmpA family protein n=1 Tax=Aliarcobacter cibarius TaxID=255507 RepID=UPI0012464D68|nr:OmpA family protein [Aliarcobacter cibarius]QEZ90334.1 OmpA domain-containing protein [Aliarcobacter cibarius]